MGIFHCHVSLLEGSTVDFLACLYSLQLGLEKNSGLKIRETHVTLWAICFFLPLFFTGKPTPQGLVHFVLEKNCFKQIVKNGPVVCNDAETQVTQEGSDENTANYSIKCAFLMSP